tara:strand:- start:4872 stop:5276 length:405 start_codon:yes stop_codon:yes gene_type:complete
LRFGPRVKAVGSFANAFSEGKLHSIDSGGKRLFSHFSLIEPKTAKHMATELRPRGPTNSYFEARKCPGTQIREKAPNPIMTTSTSAHSKPELPERQGHVIINHQDTLRGNLVETGNRRNRPTTEIHIGLGLEKE